MYKRSDVIDVLSWSIGILQENPTLQAFSRIHFQDGRMVLFNDAIDISIPFPIEHNFSVEGKKLYSLIKSLQAKDEFSLRLDSKGFVSVVNKKGNVKVKLNSYDEILEDYGVCWDYDKFEWEPLPEKFIESADTCLISVSDRMENYTLCCLHITGDTIESCDGFRISHIQGSNVGLPACADVLVLGESIKLLKQFSWVSYSIREGWIDFKSEDGIYISFRLVAGSFPDSEEVIEFTNEVPVNFGDKENLKSIISRMNVILVRKAGVGEAERRITVKVTKDKVFFIAKKGDEWIREEIEIENKKPVRFGIDFQFLNDLVTSEIMGGDVVQLELNGDKTKLRIEREDEEGKRELVHVVALAISE